MPSLGEISVLPMPSVGVGVRVGGSGVNVNVGVNVGGAGVKVCVGVGVAGEAQEAKKRATSRNSIVCFISTSL
jgi:hypothetical protein